MPKTGVFGTSPRTAQIDISPARPLFVPLHLYAPPQHGRDRPPVVDRGYGSGVPPVPLKKQWSLPPVEAIADESASRGQIKLNVDEETLKRSPRFPNPLAGPDAELQSAIFSFSAGAAPSSFTEVLSRGFLEYSKTLDSLKTVSAGYSFIVPG